MWLLSVSFHPLRFVLRPTTSKRVPKAWVCGTHTSIKYNSNHYVFYAISNVSPRFFRLSNCPEQSMRAVALGWKGNHHKNWRNMHHTSSRPWRQQSTKSTRTILSVATWFSLLRSVSAVLWGVVTFNLKKKRQAKTHFANWPVLMSTATPELTNGPSSNIYYAYRCCVFIPAVAWLCEHIHFYSLISADPW